MEVALARGQGVRFLMQRAISTLDKHRRPPIVLCPDRTDLGGIAQLVERLVRNEKVRSSNLLTSTIFSGSYKAA